MRVRIFARASRPRRFFQYVRDLELHHLGAARRGSDAREAGPPGANICRGGGALVRDAGCRPGRSPALGGVARTTPFLHGVTCVVANRQFARKSRDRLMLKPPGVGQGERERRASGEAALRALVLSFGES